MSRQLQTDSTVEDEGRSIINEPAMKDDVQEVTKSRAPTIRLNSYTSTSIHLLPKGCLPHLNMHLPFTRFTLHSLPRSPQVAQPTPALVVEETSRDCLFSQRELGSG
jgi:hypothetical protein